MCSIKIKMIFCTLKNHDNKKAKIEDYKPECEAFTDLAASVD